MFKTDSLLFFACIAVIIFFQLFDQNLILILKVFKPRFNQGFVFGFTRWVSDCSPLEKGYAIYKSALADIKLNHRTDNFGRYALNFVAEISHFFVIYAF